MNTKIQTPFLLSLFATVALTACGGGGGDSSAATKSTIPASAPTSTPVVNGESLPDLAHPQTGSTAEVGNGLEGIWSTSGASHTYATIDPTNNLQYVDGIGSIPTTEFFGSIVPASSTWVLNTGVKYSGGFYYTVSSGSGAFAAKQTFGGSYVANSSTVNVAWNYDAANALAVTQSSVAGTWGETNTSVTVDNAGAVSGNISNCPVSGTLVMATPLSKKNLYTLTVTVNGTASLCSAPSGTTFSGQAAIVFLPISGSSLYKRTIFYATKTADNSRYAIGQVAKQ
ncbi:hypothetical protein FRZ40_40775 [Paraburkholderia azotifigens]|uniref:Transferrin-binding protein-like solute binding protein n=2 Tax=Paraburkholderia azotifigens TaxID=2057004 RepID=A0A5C6V899_9BURK|nr:hypothetical protein FRZ40_40775 [Paraburkholderia azotifigens]